MTLPLGQRACARIEADAPFIRCSGLKLRERICLFSPPTGLDAHSQSALELPHRVTPLLSSGIRSRTRLANASQPPFSYPRTAPCGANDLKTNLSKSGDAFSCLIPFLMLSSFREKSCRNHVQTYNLYATLNKVFFSMPPDEILVVRPEYILSSTRGTAQNTVGFNAAMSSTNNLTSPRQNPIFAP
jgi:hypothetical protein